jgi:hypothetical protein
MYRTACRVEPALALLSTIVKNFRSRALVASLLFAVMSSASAEACDAGYKDYFGRCVEAKPAPARLLKFLDEYGQQINQVGAVAEWLA